jgi:hypothetical protein
MLTSNDITQLKTIFATKDDLRAFITKKDTEKFASKEGQQEIIEGIKTIIEMFGKEHDPQTICQQLL